MAVAEAPRLAAGTTARDARVAVIVLDHFGSERTRDCLRSLAGGPVSAAYVVDNGATVASRDALDDALVEIRAEQPGWAVQVLHPPRNLGFAAGVNLAIATDRAQPAPHDFYLLINSDAIAEPGMLAALVDAWQRDGPAVVVGPEIYDGEGGCHRELGYQRYLALLSMRPRRGFFRVLSGCCLGVPAALVPSGGLFDGAFFMYGEDVCLSWKLQRRGVTLRCVPAARVTHPARRRGGLFYEYHVARGHLLLALRLWRTPLEVPLLLLARLPVLLLRAGWRVLRQRSVVPLLALLLAALPVRLAAIRPACT